MTRADLDAQLRQQVRYCLTSPFYRRRFAELGISPESVRTLDDLNQLPILVSPPEHRRLQDATLERDGQPFGDFLCVDPAQVVSVSSTSGTTGTPVLYPFTASDVAITNETWARAFRFIGLRPGDGMVVGFGLSMYLAGVPLVRAGEAFGLRTVAVGAESGTSKLLRMLAVMRPRVLACTPSFAEHLIERAPECLGRSAASLGVEVILCAGEPGAGLPAVRQKLSDGWGGARVHDVLGGVHGVINASCASEDYPGMHVLAPDHCVTTQLVDPATKEGLTVTDGTIGERVKTALTWQAAPPLRYSVGDMYQVFTETCRCGVPGERIKVIGRVDDLLIVKGVKVYPAAVKDVVASFVPQLTGELRIVLDNPPPRVVPPLRVTVEAGVGVPAERHDELAGRLADAMHQRLAIRPQLTVVPAGTLERSSHKAKLIEVVGG
ncbi:phenylacetate-CoA ligase [Micromonospora viridifaciens]|uniref:Phenylacetate-CoA ligase n=1 Tax=Micromonospora viridifaciens TaxID=1881 RepID=A0A1C4YVK4_MICVI|nr:AMP-binding protein [Micromonospora viridifaciens]SCF24773.1 phenylacetate-CoA ligase [Micromonospora viridifaciens]